MKLLIINIKELYQTRESNVSPVSGKSMAQLPKIENAWIYLQDGLIHSYGSMSSLSSDSSWWTGFCEGDIFDAEGKIVMPAWCDSHSHIVFAKWREAEFVDKIKGLSYEEIAKRGGGILNSAARLREMSEEHLYDEALSRVDQVIKYGTGALEIKSGYGLTLKDELKMLRVIRKLKETCPLTIKSTFLGAHAVPPEFKGRQGEYVDLVINEMLPAVASENLADYIDVFCDKGFFTVEETERILEAAQKFGLKPKIHANELDFSGGVQVGVKFNAVSVDHLEISGDEEIEVLKKSNTMPTLLPNVSFYLNIPFAPARKMIDSGLPVALASDFNPGSSPSGNMQFVVSLACIKYKMLPEEAVNAATINGARAMEIDNILGSITPGKKANLIIMNDMPSLAYLPYSFGENKVERMILNGKFV
jgi:imidazolonepropionase